MILTNVQDAHGHIGTIVLAEESLRIIVSRGELSHIESLYVGDVIARMMAIRASVEWRKE